MQLRRPTLLPFFLLVFGLTGIQAQGLEIGVKGGFSVYSGDLSPQEFGVYFEDFNFAGGGYLRYRPTERFGIRVDGTFGRLSAEQETTQRPDIGEDPVTFSRNFRSTLTEFSAVLEYDLLYFGDYGNNYSAFYLYGGVGILSFNPQAELNGELIDLQPLRTEAQGLDPMNPDYATTPYELTKAVGILGGGVRTRFAGRIVLGLEMGVRFTGSDYLDDRGNTRVRYVDVISGPGGNLAGQLSNPTVVDPAEIDPDFIYTRGGQYNDYYFTGGLTLGITIGAGGSSKTGCYNF